MRYRVVGMRRHKGWTLDLREGRSLNEESEGVSDVTPLPLPHFTPLSLPHVTLLSLPSSHHYHSPCHTTISLHFTPSSPLLTTVFPHFMRCFILGLSIFHIASILNVLHTFKKLSNILRIGFWSWKGWSETWQRCQLLSQSIKRRHIKLRSYFQELKFWAQQLTVLLL